MKVYKARLRDESSDMVYGYVLADTIEEAEVKARWQYPGYASEIVDMVIYKEDEESENEKHTY